MISASRRSRSTYRDLPPQTAYSFSVPKISHVLRRTLNNQTRKSEVVTSVGAVTVEHSLQVPFLCR